MISNLSFYSWTNFLGKSLAHLPYLLKVKSRSQKEYAGHLAKLTTIWQKISEFKALTLSTTCFLRHLGLLLKNRNSCCEHSIGIHWHLQCDRNTMKLKSLNLCTSVSRKGFLISALPVYHGMSMAMFKSIGVYEQFFLIMMFNKSPLKNGLTNALLQAASWQHK